MNQLSVVIVHTAIIKSCDTIVGYQFRALASSWRPGGNLLFYSSLLDPGEEVSRGRRVKTFPGSSSVQCPHGRTSAQASYPQKESRACSEFEDVWGRRMDKYLSGGR